MTPAAPGTQQTVPEGEPLPTVPPPARVRTADPTIQITPGRPGKPPASTTPRTTDAPDETDAISAPIVNFPGLISASNPPDTTGDVGPNHFVQMVNATRYQVFDKSGTPLTSALVFGDLWPVGHPCRTNRGDPIVVYDHMADRWLLSQFGTVATGTNCMCIAISQTPNPAAGSWHLYKFDTGAVLPDYPKIGVWPDAYYMSSYEPPILGIYAFERSNMLSGAAAGQIRTTIPSLTPQAGIRDTRILPADLDGPPPPPGTPGYFVRTVDHVQDTSNPTDRIEVFEARVNWAGPTLNFTLRNTLIPTPFDILTCNRNGGGTRDCIPQPNTTATVDALANRPMMQLKYRNLGSYNSMVFNQTIDVSGSIPGLLGFTPTNEVAGIRWYQLTAVTTNWGIGQSGTFAAQPPGATTESQLIHRWMGSAAMNARGDIAIGYSIVNDDDSNPLFPGMAYTGRAFEDPAGLLPQGEGTILLGSNSKGGNGSFGNRWGDYSQMGVDPTDDCTFWFTTHDANGATRIASFRISTTCLGASLIAGSSSLTTESCSPGNGAIDPGETVTISLALTNSGAGSATNVVATLLATGGVTAPSGSQNYGTITPGGPAVTNNFTFTASGPCGGTITATLALTSGTNSLGTATFNFALGTTAATNQLSVANSTLISIPGAGPAAPYPSTINVSGQQGLVTKATVTLSNFSHTYPADVDVLLVSPAGQKVMLMSDAGGTATPGTNLVLVATDSGHYDSTGLHQPATQNYIAGENGPGASSLHRNFFTFSIPALSGTVAGAQLRLYTGINATADANETYQLLQITSAVATVTAGGSGLTNIYNDLGNGTVFGSRAFTTNESSQFITVPLGSAAISDILAHAGSSWAIGGHVTTLDANTNTVESLFGGTGPATDVQLILQIATPANLTFDDAAPTGLTTTNLISGTFKPTDFPPADVLSNPAPAGPYVTNLSAFNGASPNGTWQLFVFDDAIGDVGAFSDGWVLNLTVQSTNGCCIDPTSADLRLTMVDSPDPVLVGSNLTYTITVTNNGPATATSVSLTNLFPIGATFVSAIVSQGSVSNNAGTAVATLGTIAPGGSATLTVAVTTLAPGALSSSASVGGAQFDFDPSNNSAAASTTVTFPSLTINDVSVTEGNTGTTNAVFTVTLSPAYSQTVTVTFATSNFSALATSDYVTNSGVLTFNPGVTNQPITVAVNGDLLNESNEVFRVNLSSPSNAVIADAQGLGTILNDDPLPFLVLTNASITEGNTGSNNVFLNVRLSAPSGRTVTLAYTTSNGTATAGSDYVPRTTNLTFGVGATNLSVSFAVLGDVLVESNETFFVNFSNPTNVVITNSQSTITINDNDGLPGQVDHFVFDAISSPQNAFVPFPVTITAFDVSNNPVSGFAGPAQLSGIRVGTAASFSDGFEDGNFSDWGIGSGAFTRFVTNGLAAVGSNSFGMAGGFSNHLTGINHSLSNLTPDIVRFRVRSASTSTAAAYVLAGPNTTATNCAFFFYMQNGGFMGLVSSGASPSVPYQSNTWYTIELGFDWAARNIDYYVNGALMTADIPFRNPAISNLTRIDLYNFTPGSTAFWDEIELLSSGSVTPVPVTPTLTGSFTNGVWSGLVSVLQGATNLNLRVGDANGHTNDSGLFNVIGGTAITVNDLAIIEGNAGSNTMTFNVRLTQTNATSVSVAFATADGGATAGSDYTATNGVLIFSPGQTNLPVNVTFFGDIASEFDETFTLILSNPTNAILADPSAIGTILNDDPLFPLSSSPKRDFPQANGAINAFVTTNGVTYFGGAFTEVSLLNSGKLVPFDLGTGEPVGDPGADWPVVDNTVNTVIADGAGGWYAGGQFTSVGGEPRHRLVHVLPDRTVDPAFIANFNSTVNTLLRHGSNLYVGGVFTNMTNGGTAFARTRFAVLDAASGAPRPPEIQTDFNSTVSAFARLSNTLYVGGFFTNMTNFGAVQTARARVAALDLTTGLPTGFVADADTGGVTALALSSNALYLGGSFSNINGSAHVRIAQVDPVTGNPTSWSPAFSSTVNALAVVSNTVYVGGLFTSVTNNAVATLRSNLLALDAVTGDPTPWIPAPSSTVSALAVVGNQLVVGGFFTNIGGLTDVRRLALVDLTTAAASPAFDPDVSANVLSVAVQDGIVYAGGTFSFYKGVLRGRLAAVNSTTGDLLTWNPNASSTVQTLAAGGTNIYAGGFFATIGGLTRNRLAALDSNGTVNAAFNISFNNTVRALALVSTSLYVGGDFSNFVFSSVTTSNRGLAVLNPATGQPNTNFAPNPVPIPSGTIQPTNVGALAADATHLYVGGGFSNVGGLTRHRLARIALSNGAVDAAWAPQLNANVNALLIEGTNIHAGGSFTTVTNTTGTAFGRNRLAAIGSGNGDVTPWNPNASSTVFELVRRGTNFLAGGAFTTMSSQSRSRLAEIALSNGVSVLLPWAPVMSLDVNAIGVSSHRVFVGGSFVVASGQSRSSLAVFDPNAPPVVSPNSGPLVYNENDPELIVAPAVTVSDVNHVTLASATVTIVSNFVAAEDILSASPLGDTELAVSFGGGALTLTGPGSVEEFQRVLRSVTYRNLSENPSAAPRTLRFAADDGETPGASADVTLNVVPVNDPPTITTIGPVSTVEDIPTAPIAFTVGDVDNPLGSLILSMSAANTNLAPSGGATFAGTNASRTLTIQPGANQSGSTLVTVNVSDGALSNSTSFLLSVLTDTDGDGMPDFWEITFGLNPVDPSDAHTDKDGDGMSNLQEFLSGTSPTDSQNYLEVVAIAIVGGDAQISFTTVSGKSYLVERTDDITNGVWSTVADNVPGTGGVVDVLDTGAAAHPDRIYRVRLLPVPPLRAAFPSASSTVVGDTGFIDATRAGYFWSVTRGDSVQQTFTNTVGSITHAAFDLVVPNNILNGGASVAWQALINGTPVGSFVVPEGQLGAIHHEFTFPPVSGPTFTVRLQVTNDVAGGFGSVSLGYAGTNASFVTLRH